METQYGEGVYERIVPDDRLILFGMEFKGDAAYKVFCDGYLLGDLAAWYGRWTFTPGSRAASLMAGSVTKHTLTVSSQGQSMAVRMHCVPGEYVRGVDPDVRRGDTVFVRSVSGAIKSFGKAMADSSELCNSKIAVKDTSPLKASPAIHNKQHTWEETVWLNKGNMDAVVEKSICFIKDVVEKHSDKTCTVSLSGGKDSLATLLVVMKAGIRPKIIYADTHMDCGSSSLVKSIAERYGLEIISCGISEDVLYRNIERLGPPSVDYRWCCKVHQLSQFQILAMMLDGSNLTFVGQRRYESKKRMQNGKVLRNEWVPNQVAVAPIQEWNALHVWMYILMRKEPFNPKYAQCMPRIGCMLCPFMSLAEIEMNKHSNGKSDIWYQAIEDYGRSRGMPEEWMKYHLWRYRELPKRVYDEVGPLCGKSYEELTRRTLPPVTQPLRLKLQEGFSPCVLGYSVEAGLSRPVDVDRLYGFSKILGQRTELESGSHLSIGDITVYAEGAVISKGEDLKDVRRSIRTVFELLVKSEECCGCRQCSSRCATGALTIVDYKVEIDPSKCISCRECLCACPSLKYSTD